MDYGRKQGKQAGAFPCPAARPSSKSRCLVVKLDCYLVIITSLSYFMTEYGPMCDTKIGGL